MTIATIFAALGVGAVSFELTWWAASFWVLALVAFGYGG